MGEPDTITVEQCEAAPLFGLQWGLPSRPAEDFWSTPRGRYGLIRHHTVSCGIMGIHTDGY
jgi:hypothetical protein